MARQREEKKGLTWAEEELQRLEERLERQQERLQEQQQEQLLRLERQQQQLQEQEQLLQEQQQEQLLRRLQLEELEQQQQERQQLEERLEQQRLEQQQLERQQQQLQLAEYQRVYHQALRSGKARVSYGRIMLLGPAAVGKTSLRHGFMNEPLPDKANSTVLAHTRPVKHYWVKSGRHSVCYWAEMSEEDEISENLQLFHQYRTSLTDVERYSYRDSVVDESRHEVVHSEVTAHEAVITSRLISSKKIEDDEVFFHLWDCGGQPIFLDILPAFLSSRTVFLLMFNASKSLDEPFQVVVNNEGQQWNEEVLEISILSLLQKWMSSIYAQFGQSIQLPAYPRIIVVGTHADQLAPGQPIQARKEVIAQVFSKISSAIEGNEYADMILDMLMVDNTCAGKSDQTGSGFEELHHLIATFVQEKLTTETPISWIHLRKVLQLYIKKNKPVISLEEVYSIAKDCCIPREDVPSALLFYHELGVFLFYADIKSLKSVLFLEPQWLVDRFGELLARWKEKPEHRNMWNILTKYGILVEPLYEAVLSKVPKFGLTPSSLVDMLEHFCLAARIVTKGVHSRSGKVKEYFVPLMLRHHLSQSTLSSSQPSAVKSAAPIHLTFLSGYVPPGYFVRLATSLAAKKEVNVFFLPGIYRNQITMDIGVDRLTITEHNDTIELHFSRQALFREPFRESCQRVLKIFHECFAEVYQWLPGASAGLAFLCSECKADPGADTSWRAKACQFTVGHLETDYLHCQMGHHSLPTLPERYWLQPDSSLYKIDEVSKSLTADALIVLADKLNVNPLAVIVEQFYKDGGDDVELSQAVSDVCKTITTKQSPSQYIRGMDPHSTASKLQPTASRSSSSLSSRPTMNDLISMKRRDGSDEYLEMVRWITAHDSSHCDDFAHKLLKDMLAMKELRKKHKDDDDKFIRAVLEKWLSRDDDKKGSLPCTWEALVQCAQEAGLDGEFVKLLRDNVL